jgi:hypothetical protein
MAQSQKGTALGWGEIAKLVAGVTATECESIVGLTGACTAATGSTFANPGGATKCTGAGFELDSSADTVTTSTTTNTSDTIELDHVFTATATQSVSGFAVMNNDDDVVYAECCFADAVACASGDTLTVEMKMQIVEGS